MFVEDFIDVELSLAEVARRLAGEPAGWLGPCAERAEEAGADLVVRIGPGGLLAGARQRVRVQTGTPRARDDGMVVPLAWRTIRLQMLFPSLEGDLEVAQLGDEGCRLTLSGQYNPPLGAVGASLDRRVLHRVAASTVRSFLREAAAAMTAPHPAVAGPSPSRRRRASAVERSAVDGAAGSAPVPPTVWGQ